MDTLTGLIIGVAFGAIIAYLLTRKRAISVSTAVSSTIVMEKIERVFKIVLAEGYYSDVVDYKTQENLFFNLLKSSKKAIMIANARVLVGYDFAKVKWQIDESARRIVISAFPSPEILAIDPEYKFYDSVDGLINRVDHDDYTVMVKAAKQRIAEKAIESDLPKIAAQQMKTLLSTLDDNAPWHIVLQGSNGNYVPLPQAELPVQTQQLNQTLIEKLDA